MLARSVVAVGVCANATVANNADAARPVVRYFANISFLPDREIVVRRKHAAASAVPVPKCISTLQRIFIAMHFRAAIRIRPNMAGVRKMDADVVLAHELPRQ